MSKTKTWNGLIIVRYWSVLKKELAEAALAGSGRIGKVEPGRLHGHNVYTVWLALEEGETELPTQEIDEAVNDWLDYIEYAD